MKHDRFTRPIIILCGCILSLSLFIKAPQAATTTYDDVYQITDLTNRGLDVLLRKSKGAKQPTIPKWTEKDLNPFHVYQIQVACLDEIRSMESKFKMTPYPHIIVSPEQLNEKHLYKVSTIILSEVRRIAIHLNIWGLPKQKRSFTGEKANDIFEETIALYLKLRVLSGPKNITNQEVAGEFGRAVADVKLMLNHIDPARRYQDTFPQTPTSANNQSLNRCFKIRQELNKTRKFYKMPVITLPKQAGISRPTATDLFIQSQIVLGDINHLKTKAGVKQPTQMAITGQTMSSQLNVLDHLVRQIQPLATMITQGGNDHVQ